MRDRELTLAFGELSYEDVELVGGKNASLGEMVHNLGPAGIRVPDGFATTARAYWDFLDHNGLRDRIADLLARKDEGLIEPADAGEQIRALIVAGEFPSEAAAAIEAAYADLGVRVGRPDPDVAVRSSATAEDLPEASFAGQQETYLNVTGTAALLAAVRRCYASLFTNRAIAYRENHGFEHMKVALSAGVQRMVRSDLAAAGVMFSIDTETGFPDTVVIDGSWGLGEAVVSGLADPDEFVVFKPALDDPELRPLISCSRGRKERKIVYAGGGEQMTEELPTSAAERQAWVLDEDDVLALARWAVTIERHYGKPMDMEWGKDGETGELFILQARPETVQARRESALLKSYRLTNPGNRLLSGLAIGDAIATGEVCVLSSADEIAQFRDGAVLVTGITDPDWVPIMRRAAAIVTEHGGRTSHAAIVSRELGLPAVIGAPDATSILEERTPITVCCAEGDEGHVYEGELDYEVSDLDLEDLPATDTKVMINLADPAAAMRWWRLPADGVGLARMEFIVDNHVKVHPMALVHPDRVADPDDRRRIAELTRDYAQASDYFVDRLAQGIARIAAARYPDPVVVRMSDFKTNEYAQLIGGRAFEPHEENPMIGWRGASRYTSEGYREGFALECRAIQRVREVIGLTNVIVMIPFCRTVEEGRRTLEALAEHGLTRGANGLQVYVMAEIPSNVVMADAFAEHFDGFSIGSNDLTQLVLGVDRDSERLAHLFDENDPAVRELIHRLVQTAHAGDHPRKVGLCGQRPSDDPDFARFLVESGIDSISVAPDSFLNVKRAVAAAERRSAAVA